MFDHKITHTGQDIETEIRNFRNEIFCTVEEIYISLRRDFFCKLKEKKL